MKEALADVMVALAAKRTNAQPPTIDESGKELWESHRSFYCALSNTSDCTVKGWSFEAIHSYVRGQPDTEDGSELLQSVEETKSHAAGGRVVGITPSCQPSWDQTVGEVERSHEFQQGALTGLGSSIQVLQEHGFEDTQVLRLFAEHAAEETAVLGLSQVQGTASPVVLAWARMILAQDVLLRALGENPALSNQEGQQAASEILLGKGKCMNLTVSSMPQAIAVTVKPYMQLHCAVNSECHKTYAQIAVSADYGESLLEKAAGVVKSGSLLLLSGATATIMRIVGVQHFDSQLFTDRDSSASAFEIRLNARRAAALADVRGVLREFLQKKVGGTRHLLLAAADLLRCSSAAEEAS